MKACNPTMPAGAYNRTGDNWRPLFAIAQVAGGDWPARAADAFEELNASPPARYNGKVLWADIRRVFGEGAVERIFSADLANALCSLADRAYCGPDDLKPKGIVMTQAWLAHRLRPYGIRPRTVRIGEDRAKGYELAQFEVAFEQHLNGEGDGGERASG